MIISHFFEDYFFHRIFIIYFKFFAENIIRKSILSLCSILLEVQLSILLILFIISLLHLNFFNISIQPLYYFSYQSNHQSQGSSLLSLKNVMAKILIIFINFVVFQNFIVPFINKKPSQKLLDILGSIKLPFSQKNG